MNDITDRAVAVGCKILDEAMEQVGPLHSLRDRTVAVLKIASKRIVELEGVIEAIRWEADEVCGIEVCIWCETLHGKAHHEGCGIAKVMEEESDE